MEENMKNLIESMIYYGIAVGDESIALIIRKFNYNKGKKWSDELMAVLPENHPAKRYYSKVSNEDFEKMQLTAFAKMSMWQINNKVENWNFIASEDKVDELVEEISQMNLNEINELIRNNKNLLTEYPKKYEYYFAILYMYLLSKTENENNTKFLKNQIILIERCKFEPLFNKDEISEKFRYLVKAYDSLTWTLYQNKEYDLAEENTKKYIDFLEEYLGTHNSYKARDQLAAQYGTYGDIIKVKKGHITEEIVKLKYKAIKLMKEMSEENANEKDFLQECVEKEYRTMAFDYQDLYDSENKQEYKDMAIELFKKAIPYKEIINQKDKFNDVHSKIKSWNSLGRMYFNIGEYDKAKERWITALQICKSQDAPDEKWLEIINKNLEELNNN